MEFNKSILFLLISSSFLSFFAEATCVPRNCSIEKNAPASGPAASLGLAMFFSSLAPTESPSHSQLPSPSPSPSTSTSTSASTSPSPSLTDSGSRLSSIFSSVLPSVTNDAALTKICGLTDYPQDCVASFAPLIAGATDQISILKLGIQSLQKRFQEAMDAAKKHMEDPSASAVVKDALDTCVESFDSGISDLDDAVAAISAHDIGRLSTMLSATISYPDTCEEAFAEQSGVESLLKEIDGSLNKLASINMGICSSLKWN